MSGRESVKLRDTTSHQSLRCNFKSHTLYVENGMSQSKNLPIPREQACRVNALSAHNTQTARRVFVKARTN
ncbi:uncharacterized protein SPSK_02109 [Sporothrix schenckii 1099-18]|uniref:Uncharacterized protein n=1 Tax=Sporothrix schenckii 1099-18 TaxID=1397361 RepID=A0A0F2MCT1_SPOSC|nr:uncharacterized protein SPSK_02109 [Sporothrix schenckii 1099-18]KJR87442.1 hypothetical protein SPSK_02109 [Sporothrix schenckii 1099-18]